MRKLVLASESPRRAELLRSLGVEFEVVKPAFDEREAQERAGDMHYLSLSALLAKGKVEEVAERLYDNAVIIGADTIVCLGEGKEILGKPRDAVDARRMLELLSGRDHFVATGVHILDTRTGDSENFSSQAVVSFDTLSKETIDWYIFTTEPFGRAGAYAVQGQGAALVKNVSGDYRTVIGLPLDKVRASLKRFKVF